MAGKDVEIQLTPVSPHTFRLTVQPVVDGKLLAVPDDGTLVQASFGQPKAQFRADSRAQTVSSETSEFGSRRIH